MMSFAAKKPFRVGWSRKMAVAATRAVVRSQFAATRRTIRRFVPAMPAAKPLSLTGRVGDARRRLDGHWRAEALRPVRDAMEHRHEEGVVKPFQDDAVPGRLDRSARGHRQRRAEHERCDEGAPHALDPLRITAPSPVWTLDSRLDLSTGFDNVGFGFVVACVTIQGRIAHESG